MPLVELSSAPNLAYLAAEDSDQLCRRAVDIMQQLPVALLDRDRDRSKRLESEAAIILGAMHLRFGEDATNKELISFLNCLPEEGRLAVLAAMATSLVARGKKMGL